MKRILAAWFHLNISGASYSFTSYKHGISLYSIHAHVVFFQFGFVKAEYRILYSSHYGSRGH